MNQTIATVIRPSVAMVRSLNPRVNADLEFVNAVLRRFMIRNFQRYYPDVNQWYDKKVVRGFISGMRFIHVASRGADQAIVGVVIGKLSRKPYNKICSFLIVPEFRGGGVGKRLMSGMLSLLAERSKGKPTVITVPEERATERNGGKSLLQFLQAFGFKVITVIPNRYRAGKSEMIYLTDCKSLPFQ